MAILDINVGLSASFLNEKIVCKDMFVDKLSGLNDACVKDYIYDRDDGLSSIVIFVEEQISNYQQFNDPDYELEKMLKVNFNEISNWLKKQQLEVFDNFTNIGLKVWLFIELWIEDDQLDLVIPPELMLQCGRLGLEIQINSNE